MWGSDISGEFDSAWEKHTQVTERPLRSAQGLSLHILTHIHTVVGTVQGLSLHILTHVCTVVGTVCCLSLHIKVRDTLCESTVQMLHVLHSFICVFETQF